MKVPFSYVTQVVETLMRSSAKRTTKFIGPNQIIRATRRHREGNDLVLHMGAPNYAEREQMKRMRKSGLSFPIKPVIVTNYPKKKTPAPKRRGR